MFDYLYLLFILPGLALAILAQLFVWIAYSMYSNQSSGTNITGAQAASIITQKYNYPVQLQMQNGHLIDNFNPFNNVVTLSSSNATSGSVANIAVVAHEFGHVEQKFKGSQIFKLRSAIVPAVNFGSSIGYFLIILGLLFSITGLAWVGVALFSLTFIFSLITFPLELDASIRGMRIIRENNLISANNVGGAKIVLIAAAFTYLAALVQSLGQLLYFITLVNRRR